MSKLSKQNFKLSAVLETKKFMDFSHYYGNFSKAEKYYDSYKDGNRSFSTAEMENPEEELKNRYIESVHRAINKLFVLDRAFFKTEGVHIVAKLECFDDYVEVLHEIAAFANASTGN